MSISNTVRVKNATAASDYWIQYNRTKSWPAFQPAAPELRVVDLFSGCGGLTLGAFIACEQLNRQLKVCLAADVWSEALEVYKHNFSHVLDYSTTADLSTLVVNPGSAALSPTGIELAENLGQVNVIVAGPPCQGHSDLNNSSRRDDPRNLLYTIPVAFALHLRPEIVLIENVPTVIHAEHNVVSSAQQLLINSGYAVLEIVANAQNFGLPQTRKRHIMLASRTLSKMEMIDRLSKLETRSDDVQLWDFISDLENEAEDKDLLITKRSKISPDNIRRINYLFDADVFDLPNEHRPPCHRDKEHSYVSMYGRLNHSKPAQTITSGFGSMGQGRFVHPTQRRMITPHEAARIQGFPDYFDFNPAGKITALREMIGNAVPPPVAAVLLTALLSGSR
ncbi:DNA cytosine methyltransferase [Oxalobacteraceae bacterium OTU3CAMAD1]|nr:DNA cytosine methyltransferase [Oxalobacteraceae bacterium OTU3CAMAD1]